MAASHFFVATAGLFRGQLEDPSLILLAFLIVQLAGLIYTALVSHQSRLAGLLIAWFCATYALFAAFIAAMSFPDTWL